MTPIMTLKQQDGSASSVPINIEFKAELVKERDLFFDGVSTADEGKRPFF